ncbi:Rieske (2Fe-2S) protein [Natronoarchaeum rubrum]|uniref:Rieske (2Fe-2S) protein n=1 Tax=Natronoarchaeum rubrum TaxID=755311 RepID=UPI0035BEBFEF
MPPGAEIAAAEEIPDESTLIFTVRDADGDEREAILVELDGKIAGWLNACQHMTHIRIDKGSGAAMRNGELVCENHGAYFEADSGYCSFGPCEGAYLEEVGVTVDGGTAYLTDDDYEFVRVGPVEDDPADLSSSSNVKI